MIDVNNQALKDYKFIDLFCGIGGFHWALSSFGARCVFASDIDKNAREVYQNNFSIEPDGDITKIDEKNIPKHDILCAGFPCQPFSISGQQQGFNDNKHPKFSGEQEYRFVIEFNNEKQNDELDFREWIDNSKSITEDFCVKNGIITPFLNVPFSENAIARVYLSPMMEFEIAKQSIREIIYKNNYRVFSIWESKIPIRY